MPSIAAFLLGVIVGLFIGYWRMASYIQRYPEKFGLWRLMG